MSCTSLRYSVIFRKLHQQLGRKYLLHLATTTLGLFPWKIWQAAVKIDILSNDITLKHPQPRLYLSILIDYYDKEKA